MQKDRIILNITPQTWVRIVSGKHGDHVLFNIPEVCTKGDENGAACHEYYETGLCSHTLSESGRRRKRRIERYNKYRIDLFTLAKEADFQLPTCGWSLYFYLPMPKRWTKKMKAQMHGNLHHRKPDDDNLLKAFKDSLSIVDEQVSQMSGFGKFWVNQATGYIEILLNQPVYNPFGVELIGKDKLVSMQDIETSRAKRAARKEEIRKEKKERQKKEKEIKPVNKFRRHKKTDTLF